MHNKIFPMYLLSIHLLEYGTVQVFEAIVVNMRGVCGIYIPSRETDTKQLIV